MRTLDGQGRGWERGKAGPEVDSACLGAGVVYPQVR
jgi:hypothetical protein